MSDLTIRPAAPTEADVKAIYALLLNMFDEQTMFALSPNKALAEIYRVVADSAAWMVFDGERLVASAGIVQAEFWYSDEPGLVSRWLYVLPAYRQPGGDSWVKLLEEIEALGKMAGMAALIDIFNPARIRPARGVAAVATRMGFYPKGAWLRIEPAADKEPV